MTAAKAQITDVNPKLASLTTLRVGGPPGRLVTATTETEIVEQVSKADNEGTPLLILGGGSNVLIADEGWPGTVLLVRNRGITQPARDGEFLVASGENWDGFVNHVIQQGYSGVEALSGIPGLIGATPIQNVGAYGQEVADVIREVRAWDRTRGEIIELKSSACDFSYRNSRFKQHPNRLVILSVTFELKKAGSSQPIKYDQLASALRIEVGEEADLQATRDAVLQLRRAKGMVLDDSDPDTWSAGSFFTNPILTPEQAARLPHDAPKYSAPNGVKASAAWLIEQADFGRSYGRGPARLSTKHTLALTNTGLATAADILELAREIRAGVQHRFGVELQPEPVFVGCEL